MVGLLLVLAVMTLGRPASAILQMSPGKECATCHIMWVDAFRKGEETLIPWGGEQTLRESRRGEESSELMCYSCHDGYVRDSRLQAWSYYQHPTKNGTLYCGTCHTPHSGSVTEPVVMEESSFLRVVGGASELCVECHDDKIASDDVSNHPIGARDVGVHRQSSDGAPADLLSEGQDPQREQSRVGCESCHQMHGARHDALIRLAATGETIFGSPLCEECHSAEDARYSLGQYSHPVGAEAEMPSGAPVMFSNGFWPSYGKAGSLNCLSCHAVHDGLEGTALLAETLEEEQLCLECHPKVSTVSSTKHDLTSGDLSTQEISDNTCGFCHRAHKGYGPFMWAQTLGGQLDLASQLCASCHANDEKPLTPMPGAHSHPVNVTPSVTMRRSVQHGADPNRASPSEQPSIFPFYTSNLEENEKTGNVVCLTCHDPHGGVATTTSGANHLSREKFLRVGVEKISDICQYCHEDVFDAISGTEHDLLITAPTERNLMDQSVDEGGLCSPCHVVHRGVAPALWAKALPQTAHDAVTLMCNSCHNSEGCAAAKLFDDLVHEPRRGGPRTTSGALLPVYTFDGEKSSEGYVTCLSCHDPHRFSPTAGAQNPQANVEGDGSNSFLRMRSDGDAPLCQGCHAKQAMLLNTQHDLRVMALDVRNSRGQRAADSGVCLVCHNLYASGRGEKAWARTLDTGWPDSAALCLSCHQDESVVHKRLNPDTSHPMEVKPSPGGSPIMLALRNGEQQTIPLIEEKLYCTSCHDAHRYNPVSDAKQFSPGIAAGFFLRLLPGTHEGLCAQCHPGEQLVIGTDHDLSVTAPDETNRAGLRTVEGGVCSACHVMHPGVDDRPVALTRLYLWAKSLDGLPQRPSALCLSCHREGGCAAHKVPQLLEHPTTVRVEFPSAIESILQYSKVIVYDDEGRISTEGMISCGSCHDAHRWDIDESRSGSGKNPEGTAVTSFLHTWSFQLFCKNCHGAQALFKYKYFHFAKRTKK